MAPPSWNYNSFPGKHEILFILNFGLGFSVLQILFLSQIYGSRERDIFKWKKFGNCGHAP